jgi:hypothetical protein
MWYFYKLNNLIKYTHLIFVIKGDDGVSCASEFSCSLSLPPVLLRSDLRSLQQNLNLEKTKFFKFYLLFFLKTIISLLNDRTYLASCFISVKHNFLPGWENKLQLH